MHKWRITIGQEADPMLKILDEKVLRTDDDIRKLYKDSKMGVR